MKRKKLYSVLALGMAVVLMAGVPVSAAPSRTTSDFEVDEEKKTEVTVGDQTYETTPDKDGDIVLVTTTSTDSTVTIDNAINNKNAVDKENDTLAVGALKKNDLEVENPEEAAKVEVKDIKDTAKKADLMKESKKNFKALDATKIKADVGDREVTIIPVNADVQNVAQNAAEAMAVQLGLQKKNDDDSVSGVEIMASADIHVSGEVGKDGVRVMIPLDTSDDNNKIDTSKYVYYVLHYSYADKAWNTLPAEVTTDGIIVATFDSFSPVFIVKSLKPDAPEPDTPNDENNDENNDGDGDGGEDGSNDSYVSNTKANANAAVFANPTAVPSNPAVSPKTGE